MFLVRRRRPRLVMISGKAVRKKGILHIADQDVRAMLAGKGKTFNADLLEKP